MKIIGPFSRYYIKKKIPKIQRQIKEQTILTQLEMVREVNKITEITGIEEDEVRAIIQSLIEKRKIEGELKEDRFVKIKKKGEKIIKELTEEERKAKFEQILMKYEEIEIETMAELLGFTDELALQKFLLDLPTDNIRIKGKTVFVDKKGVSGEIENLLEQFQKWEKSGIGKV
ncbi:MAG: hypothetical protein K9W45_07375 [Candidatus Heimdallarchaeum aukensis]|uniref:Uncharacterized protein n=1 Tax=Candidatus Heimdallarchaeum aukensis TaxID=2876573 RepID=A0A9Y1BIS7_9ARCH|nr:MAG: hypothetical protein K9W45_07375 [Candidatus Heimdallarchaeum aukensis]